MITLDFTKISFVVALSFLSTATPSWSQGIDEATHFENSKIQLRTICDDKDGGTDCSVFSIDGGAKKKLISFPFAPSDIKFSSGVFVIIFPCGTECSATYFYNPSKGVGGPFPQIASYDLKRGLALSLSKNPLPVFNIYASRGEKPVFTVKLNAGGSRNLIDLVKKAELKDGKATVTYVDSKGREKTVVQSIEK
jgi:hypothetical protein